MNCKVSVAMCTYNGSKFIKEQIESILIQTRQPDEIIICDDISSDNTIGTIQSILDKENIQFKIIVNESRLGVTKNFEKAIKLCTGDIIFTSDQDDYWIRTKIERILDEFQRNPNANLIFSNAMLVDSNLVKLPGNLWETIGFSLNKLEENKLNNLELILKNNFVTGATMAFRKDVIKYCLPIPSSWIHDYWIAVQCIIEGKILGITDMLILYRQHGENVIGAKKMSFYSKVKKYVLNFGSINFEGVEAMRVQKLNMIRELRHNLENENTKIDEKTMNLIKQGIVFFERRVNQFDNSKLISIKEILIDVFSCKYSKFYTGVRGAFRDIYVVINRW